MLNILNLISFDDEYSLPFTGDTIIAIIYKVEDDKLICIEKVKKDVLDYLKSDHYLLDDKSIEYFCVKNNLDIRNDDERLEYLVNNNIEVNDVLSILPDWHREIFNHNVEKEFNKFLKREIYRFPTKDKPILVNLCRRGHDYKSLNVHTRSFCSYESAYSELNELELNKKKYSSYYRVTDLFTFVPDGCY